MVAFVNSLFKTDLHEAPQERKVKDKDNHVIQVVIIIFFRDLQWIKFIFLGLQQDQKLGRSRAFHQEEMG